MRYFGCKTGIEPRFDVATGRAGLLVELQRPQGQSAHQCEMAKLSISCLLRARVII